jgi:hypothetical protein
MVPYSPPTFGLAGEFGKFLIAARFATIGRHGAKRQHTKSSRMGTFPPIDLKDTAAVAAFVIERFIRMFPGEDKSWLQTVFRDTVDLFEGRHVDYAPIDLQYHDLEHTLQATTCITLLLENRHTAGVVPCIGRRDFELALAAALLHDSGYLKLRSDRAGTGAKYTYCHVLRSCAFAATYLPTRGANELEIEVVLGAISCTGPLREFSHLPMERRTFKSPADLTQRTPDFWENFVRRKLEVECQALYRFLAAPYPHGPNAYVDAVERNIAEVRRRTAAAQPAIVAK